MPHILLAEDDEYLGRVYERAFRFGGFEVALVEDGEAALKVLSTMISLPPAAIVLDIAMPKLDGFKVLQTLRKDPRYAEVPIVILTNSATGYEREHCLQAGADLYLVKAQEQTAEVVEKVKELINNGRPAETVKT